MAFRVSEPVGVISFSALKTECVTSSLNSGGLFVALLLLLPFCCFS